ncbi:hypothetical protein NPIL_161 [Nephila pilipes]|uniref:Uncharacterized protein n=1 Tax=Nephila pilipes TaxID=299642 RepID=A0A8X6QQS5_NEPPI|nr:hypothetical protein NPIL_161 [Nephila pilipes]
MTDSLPTEASEEDTELFFTKHHEEIKMLIELRDAYALWAKRLSAASSKNPEEFKKAHTELGVVYTQLTAIKAKLQVSLFKLPINIEVLDKIVLKVQKKTEKFKKIAEKKKETPKNVIPTKTQAKSMAPAKIMAKKNLKRAADSDGFQLPPKHLTVKAGKLNSCTSLPTVQTSPPTTSSKGDEAISEEEDAGEPVPPTTTKP